MNFLFIPCISGLTCMRCKFTKRKLTSLKNITSTKLFIFNLHHYTKKKNKIKQRKETFTLFTYQGSIKQYYIGITGFRNRQ